MNADNFKVASKIAGDAVVIYPRGYLNNISGESLVAECTDYIGKGKKKFILNLQETDFINSIGISLLLHIMENLRGINGTLCFSDMSRIHRDTFEMLGLSKHMLVFSNETEALQYLDSTTV